VEQAIRCEGLSKAFGRTRALQGLELAVPAGAVFGFLGPNGAGKTTTMRLLAGLARPSAGSAWICGQKVRAGSREIARLVGYLPEEPAFYGWMRPREFLDYVARLFGFGPAERQRRVEMVLETVGLQDVAGRRISGLSRGMRQRLGLAQALVHGPRVLLLDEPASALDPIGRREILEFIRALAPDCTVFFSTHILADVERICDQVAVIANGRLVVQARTEELLRRYALPVFEVEVEPGQGVALQRWLQELGAAGWLLGVSHAADGNSARILCREVSEARQALIAGLAQASLPITRLELVRPSLEEVFVRLVQGEADK
jgi:ABC-2 type transport system ATP-binding protein